MKHSVKTALCYVFAVAFVLAGWQITALALNTPALPGPIETVGVFVRYAGILWPDFLTSLGRLAISLALGCVLGVPVGLFLGRSQKVGALFSPVLYLLYPLPKIVLLPILLVLFGLGGAPKIALVTITVFFQVVMVMRDAAAAIPAATWCCRPRCPSSSPRCACHAPWPSPCSSSPSPSRVPRAWATSS